MTVRRQDITFFDEDDVTPLLGTVDGSGNITEPSFSTHGTAAAPPPTSDPLGEGNTALISALGGNAAVLALYDVRKNVTLVGSKASVVDDVRGSSGFAPSLSQANDANRPLFSGTSDADYLITGAGDFNSWLVTAASPLFDLSVAKTIVYVGNFPANSGNIDFAINDGTSARWMGANTANTANIYGRWPSGLVLSGAAHGSGLRRLVLVGKNATTTGYVEVPDVSQKTVAITAIASGNNKLFVHKGNDSSTPRDNAWRAILVLNGLYTTGQRDALKTWASTYHSYVTAT